MLIHAHSFEIDVLHKTKEEEKIYDWTQRKNGDYVYDCV